jgi:hypothetical protein
LLRRPGPIETLSDAIQARRRLWVLCRACGHAVRLDPRNLMALRGPSMLRALQRQLTCQRCRRQRAAVIADDEEWIGRD